MTFIPIIKLLFLVGIKKQVENPWQIDKGKAKVGKMP